MWTQRRSSTHPWPININTVATRVRLILFITPASIVHSVFVVPRPVTSAVDSFLSSLSNYFRLCPLAQKALRNEMSSVVSHLKMKMKITHTHRVATTHRVWSVINLNPVKPTRVMPVENAIAIHGNSPISLIPQCCLFKTGVQTRPTYTARIWIGPTFCSNRR